MIATTETCEATYACGHTKLRSKSRSNSMHLVFIKAAAERLCDACVKKHEDARISMLEAAEERSKTIVAETKLRGSPKQIEWAESIRAGWRASFFRFSCRDVPLMKTTRESIMKKVVNASPEALEEAITNVLAERLAGLEESLTESRSRFWIDDRTYHYHFNTIVTEREKAAIKSAITLLTQEAA